MRSDSQARARSRILTDDELRRIWHAAGPSPFGRLVRFLLLTGARRGEAANITQDELSGGLWTLPGERNKTKRELVRPLSAAAQATLSGGQEGPYVFGGDRPIRGFSECRRSLDRRSGTSGWTLHDLRRTSRSLMSRAGVSSDVAERCLGHTIGSVRKIYDRHDYVTEMAKAYDALAGLIEQLVNPVDNVEQLRARP